jgi:hypothetical protein
VSRAPDADTRLCRTLEMESRRAGCPVRVISSDWNRWQSTTFTGARHELTMEAADTAALEHWLSDLPATDLPVRGHLLASLAITNIRRAGGMAEVAIDALTVEQ